MVLGVFGKRIGGEIRKRRKHKEKNEDSEVHLFELVPLNWSNVFLVVVIVYLPVSIKLRQIEF